MHNNKTTIIMKTSTFKLLLALILFTPFLSRATYVKQIHKGWDINKVEALQIENKFGHINFVHTRDDSVVIDVVIEIENLADSRAAALADEINFNFSFADGTIKAQTSFSPQFKTTQDFSIQYTINIPADRNLRVDNRYGNVSLNDLNAHGDFRIHYGNFQAQDLLSPDGQPIRFEIKYGNANFSKASLIDVQIAYGKINAFQIGKGRFDSKYSVIKIDETQQLKAVSQYDHYEIERCEILMADSKFTGWNIDQLNRHLEMETQYGDIKVDEVAGNFELISIINRYGNIRINIPESVSYQLESECYYCRVKHPEATILQKRDENNYSLIRACIGDENAKASVKIESRYGKVNLMD